MSWKKVWIAGYALIILLIGYSIYSLRYNPTREDSNALTRHDLDVFKKWSSLPFIPISSSRQFANFVSTIPIDLQTSISIEQNRKLRQTLTDFFRILRYEDCQAYINFQAKRNQLVYNEKGVIETAKELHIDPLVSVPELYKKIWARKNNPMKSPFLAMSTSGTQMRIARTDGEKTIRSFVLATTNKIWNLQSTDEVEGWFEGHRILQDGKKLLTTNTVTIAQLITVVKSSSPDPALRWLFTFAYFDDIENWVYVSSVRFYPGIIKHDQFQ